MANQTVDVNDLLSNARHECHTAIEHVINLIFVGSGWTLFQDEKTKLSKLKNEEGSRADSVIEDSNDLNDLLNSATVTYHDAIQTTVNSILDLISFGRKIYKDESSLWSWTYDDSNPAEGRETEGGSRKLDIHIEDGKKGREGGKDKPKTADDAETGGKGRKRNSDRRFEDGRMRREQITNDIRSPEDNIRIGEPAQGKDAPVIRTEHSESDFQAAQQDLETGSTSNVSHKTADDRDTEGGGGSRKLDKHIEDGNNKRPEKIGKPKTTDDRQEGEQNVEIIDGEKRKQPRKVRKVPATKSQDEARTAKKEYIMKKGVGSPKRYCDDSRNS